jgi:transcriptional regulator with XRE-family HTH domain
MKKEIERIADDLQKIINAKNDAPFTVQQVAEKLKLFDLKQVAAASGVSYHTLWQIKKGGHTNVRPETLAKIETFLRGVGN